MNRLDAALNFAAPGFGWLAIGFLLGALFMLVVTDVVRPALRERQERK